MIFFKKKKRQDNNKLITSNIIQFDDMGYPLMLCISGNDQIWVDMSKEYAEKGLKSGKFHVLEWEK